MGNRLSKITTRTGDDGTTGLGDGSRIRKSAARVVVLGEIDELNCQIGLVANTVRNSLPDAPGAMELGSLLYRIQNQLFDLGGELSIPGYKMISEQHILTLDTAIAHYNRDLPALKEFVLPGGSEAAARAHVARAVARRAERALVALAHEGAGSTVSTPALQYLNRLSDLLFILARCLNRMSGVADVVWARDASPSASPTASPSTAPAEA